MDLRIVLVIAGSATTYYHIGQNEYGRGFLVAVISIFISVATFFGLGWSILGVLLAQLGLFTVLTVINCRRKHN
jgi:hypothetical protein